MHCARLPGFDALRQVICDGQLPGFAALRHVICGGEETAGHSDGSNDSRPALNSKGTLQQNDAGPTRYTRRFFM